MAPQVAVADEPAGPVTPAITSAAKAARTMARVSVMAGSPSGQDDTVNDWSRLAGGRFKARIRIFSRNENKMAARGLHAHVPQGLQEVWPECRIVLDHGEMPHAFHDGQARARDRRGHRLAHVGRAGIIVLAGQKRDL